MAFKKIEGNAQLMKKLRYQGTPELVIKRYCERKKQTLERVREIGGGGKRKNERKEERKRAVRETDADGSLTLF